MNTLPKEIQIEEKEDTVIIRQTDLIEGKVYSNKTLYTIAKNLYPDKKIVPVVFLFDKESITLTWINTQIEQHKVSKKDLTKFLPFSSEQITEILNENYKLNKTEKALFFYFFQTIINTSF